MASVEWWVLGSAIVLTAAAGVLWRTPHALGSVAAGGLLAVLNLVVLRRTVAGFWSSSGSPARQVGLAVVLFLKMGLLLGAIWAVVKLLGFSPIGVGMGVSATVLGIMGGTLAAPQQRNAKRA